MTPTLVAPESLEAARAGTLGIGPPRLPSNIGPYAALLCEDCGKREPVATVRYIDGGPMVVCEVCLPGVLEIGGELE